MRQRFMLCLAIAMMAMVVMAQEKKTWAVGLQVY